MNKNVELICEDGVNYYYPAYGSWKQDILDSNGRTIGFTILPATGLYLSPNPAKIDAWGKIVERPVGTHL